jgi:hypothetical protein
MQRPFSSRTGTGACRCRAADALPARPATAARNSASRADRLLPMASYLAPYAAGAGAVLGIAGAVLQFAMASQRGASFVVVARVFLPRWRQSPALKLHPAGGMVTYIPSPPLASSGRSQARGYIRRPLAPLALGRSAVAPIGRTAGRMRRRTAAPSSFPIVISPRSGPLPERACRVAGLPSQPRPLQMTNGSAPRRSIVQLTLDAIGRVNAGPGIRQPVAGLP